MVDAKRHGRIAETCEGGLMAIVLATATGA